MASFPALFGGSVALYPFQRRKVVRVSRFEFSDGSEQRHRESAGLQRFTLSLDGIGKAEKDAIVEFFEDAKGGFDATWDIEVEGEVWQYMAFASDSLEATEEDDGWSMRFEVIQTRRN